VPVSGHPQPDGAEMTAVDWHDIGTLDRLSVHPSMRLRIDHAISPRCGRLRTDWERDWAQMTGWKRWIEVAGTVHPSFTDVGLFADHYGVNLGATTTAERTQTITRAYVNAFFDRHLRGRSSALLDAPSPRYPEVAFCR
jgi:hypothetical protein